MAIFNSDLEALIYISIIIFLFILLSKFISTLFKRIKKVSLKTENKISFVLDLTLVVITVYLIIEGFPSFQEIDPTYAAILTGAITTAIAFASSGVFKNFVSGIILMFIGPFEVGDVVKVKGNKGIIRNITLTKVLLETFDGKFIQISNIELFSSNITNYTIRIRRFRKIKTFQQFKDLVQSPQVRALSKLNKLDEEYLRLIFEEVKGERIQVIHRYTFRMEFPFEGFRKTIDEIQKVCIKYREIFGARPWFDIVFFGPRIHIKFTIITLNSNTILQDQPDFAKDIYTIIVSNLF